MSLPNGLPHIDTCLDAMSSAAWFSTMDLRQSYHQVPVEPRDRDKTASSAIEECSDIG